MAFPAKLRDFYEIGGFKQGDIFNTYTLCLLQKRDVYNVTRRNQL